MSITKLFCGFKPVQADFFRKNTPIKGQNLCESAHVKDVCEIIVKDGQSTHSRITAKVIKQI
jgi:hypothetical protein